MGERVTSLQVTRSSATVEIARVVSHKPLPKTKLQGYIFCRWQYGSIASVNLKQLAPKTAVCVK